MPVNFEFWLSNKYPCFIFIFFFKCAVATSAQVILLYKSCSSFPGLRLPDQAGISTGLCCCCLATAFTDISAPHKSLSKKTENHQLHLQVWKLRLKSHSSQRSVSGLDIFRYLSYAPSSPPPSSSWFVSRAWFIEWVPVYNCTRFFTIYQVIGGRRVWGLLLPSATHLQTLRKAEFSKQPSLAHLTKENLWSKFHSKSFDLSLWCGL